MCSRPLLFAMLAATTSLFWVASPVRSARLTNADVTFVSFGSVNGEVADCGCKARPKGGLDLRAGYIDWLRNENVPFLHLDLGNFSSTTEHTKEALTRFVWEAMEEMEVAATTPGPRELQEWALFQELREGSPVRVISTNLTYLDSGQEKPVGDRYTVLVRNGISIGLIGLIGEQAFASVRPPLSDVRMSDAATSARQAIEELEGDADLIVLLAQLTSAELRDVLKAAPGIDVVLSGYLTPFMEEAEVEGNTIIQQTGTRGHYLGSLTVTLDPQGQRIVHSTHNVVMWDPIPRKMSMKERVEALEARNEEVIAKARAAALQSGD